MLQFDRVRGTGTSHPLEKTGHPVTSPFDTFVVRSSFVIYLFVVNILGIAGSSLHRNRCRTLHLRVLTRIPWWRW